MSHTLYEANAHRVHRCELAVPGSNPEMFEKALKSGVDVIFLDLEDAVAPDDKLQARKNVIKAINELDWAGHGITVSIRINGLDTQYMVRDIVDLVEQCGEKIDTILIPKVGVYSDVYMVESMLNQLEMQQGLTKKIGIECLIETALGMANVEDIAKQGAIGGRLEALHFGVADYAASNRARTTNIGGLNPDYPGDQWHYAISRMTVACRAYGLRAIDGPFGDFKDPEGFKDAARRAAAIGCEGKWAIHPSQIALANDVFTPPESEVQKAKRILAALKEAAEQGKGAAALDGRLIDAASEKMANNVVSTAAAIAAKA
ncbi:malyl-CoA lyase [Methyloprofundus sedimenti]|uniref:Malyl-CoA lyase n=1 Tax=Methyloprofundus sedimenti TaxID=1420851 RepID=A0A1V8M2Y0_9GAMM|nr:CoA ester lyase [Methyloprofundus sedimenti]OQK15920.1 malyl-CoA lyase [Methyloprofundus sedimenti]